MKNLIAVFAICTLLEPLYAQTSERGPNGKWGIVDFDGEILVPYEYDERIDRYDTLMIVKKQGRKGIIDNKGKVVVDFSYKEIEIFYDPMFNVTVNGYYKATKTQKKSSWGIISKDNNMILPFKFDEFTNISSTLFAAKADQDTMYSFFDKEGNLKFKLAGKRVYRSTEFPNTKAITVLLNKSDPNRNTIFDFNGKPLPNIYQKSYWGNEKYFIRYEKDKGVGVVDSTDRVLIPFEYSSMMSPGLDGEFLVFNKKSHHGVINLQNQPIIPFDDQYIVRSGSIYTISKRGQSGEAIYGAAGHKIAEFGYQVFGVYTKSPSSKIKNAYFNNYFMLKNLETGLVALYKKDGTQLLPFQYTYIYYHSEDHPIIAFQGTWSEPQFFIFDLHGRQVSADSYPELEYTKAPGLLIGKNNMGKWSFIKSDQKGFSAKFEYEGMYRMPGSGYIITDKGGKLQLFDPYGKLVSTKKYSQLKSPDEYEAKYFPRLPGFKGKLIATGRKPDTPSDLTIGINEQGEEYLLNVMETLNLIKENAAKNTYPAQEIIVPAPVEEDGELLVEIEAPEASKIKRTKPSKEDRKYEVLDKIEQLPEYPGGLDSLLKFISQKFRYPTLAANVNIQGKVIVQFFVEKDGSLSGAQIIEDLGADCGKEALRLVSIMPKWVPAKDKGKTVRSTVRLPIIFYLPE